MMRSILFFAICAGAAAQNHRLTLEDLLAPEAIGESALSPDGKTFAMSRNGQIVLMPSEGGWPVTLTSAAGGKSGLSWSPDGRTIAYASRGGIWTIAVAGGVPRRLTNAAAGGGDPRQASDRAPQWSPKGRWILYETGRRGHNNMMVVSEDGKINSYITEANADEEGAAWSPDGSQISYTERTPKFFSGKLDVVKFDPATGTAGGDPVTWYTAPNDRGGGWSIRRARWSPDGKSLAVVLQESGWYNVYLIPGAGSLPKPITKGEFEDGAFEFSPDGKSIAVVSNRANKLSTSIVIAALDGTPARQLNATKSLGTESAPEWSPDGSKIYFRRNTPTTSNDLFVADVKGGAPIALTHTTPKIFDVAARPPQEIHYHGRDGLDISALLYKPEGWKSDTRYPAVLWIHGGPEAIDSFRFDPWAQYLSQSGYVVLEPNYRGGTGYGERFRNMNVEDSGGGEMDDVAAGAQYLITQGLADSKRIAIGGGSHGGTMVGYAVTKYPDLFAAAIELYGVVDRATFNERTNRNSAVRWMMKMGGTPEEKPLVYRKANTLADVAKIRTPLLIMHGENDPQVPPYESAQFVRALKENHKVYYYFTYPNEQHGFSEREHRLDAWRRQLAFLEKYIKPDFGVSSTSTDDLLGPPSPAPRGAN